jgi:DNA-binding Xre family transcriptional regulator
MRKVRRINEKRLMRKIGIGEVKVLVLTDGKTVK